MYLSTDLGGKLISSLPRWKSISEEVTPTLTPLTLKIPGSETDLENIKIHNNL